MVQSVPAIRSTSGTQAKTFEEQFVEEAMHSQALDDFLSLTDYPAFVKRMHRELQSRHQDATLPDADWLRQLSTSSRPETHWSDEVPCTMLHLFPRHVSVEGC